MSVPRSKKTLNVISLNSVERTSSLISTFSGGYTSEWTFKLPKAFQAALDIKLTPRVINKKRQQIWTQGNSFSFKVGDTIYDTILAYTHLWDEALRHIRFAIKITEASEDQVVTVETIQAQDKDESLQINLNRIIEGHLTFNLLVVQEDALVHFRTIESTQSEFIRFLQQGKMFCLKQSKIDLDEIRRECYPNVERLRSPRKKTG